MYKSLESTPVEDWEVIPSISVAVGEYLKAHTSKNDCQPVLFINPEQAQNVLQNIQADDVEPTIVALEIIKTPQKLPQGTYPKAAQGTAVKTGWGTRTEVSFLYSAENETEKVHLGNEVLQSTAVHELQHAADFASEKILKKDQKYHKKINKNLERIQAASDVQGLGYFKLLGNRVVAFFSSGLTPAFVEGSSFHKHKYYNSPFEKRAFQTEKGDFPPILWLEYEYSGTEAEEPLEEVDFTVVEQGLSFEPQPIELLQEAVTILAKSSSNS